MPYDQKKTGVIATGGGRFGVDVAEPPPCCLCVDCMALPGCSVLHPRTVSTCPDCISTADNDCNDDDRILSSVTGGVTTTFSHNNRGDLASKTVPGTGTTEYTFNASGELRKIEYPDDSSSVYDYDPGSIRRRKTEKNTAGDIIAETRYFYADLNGLPRIISEEKLFGSDPRFTHYAYAQELLLRDINGNIIYFLIDDNVNVIALADESGSINDKYEYSPFGILLSHAGSDSNTLLFLSEPIDLNSSLSYLRRRYLDNVCGRFIAKDMASLYGVNRYVYCRNNPVEWIDPLGLFDVKKEVLKYKKIIIMASEKSEEKIPPEVIAAMLKKEIKFMGPANKWIKKKKLEAATFGKSMSQISIGLAQIKVETASNVDMYYHKNNGVRLHNAAWYYHELQKDKVNLLYAANYLSMIKAKYKKATGKKDKELRIGDWAKIVSLYNTGMSGVSLKGTKYLSEYSGETIEDIRYFKKQF